MMKRLRILHAWDTAGVASVLARTMDKVCSTRSKVLMLKKFDPFGLSIGSIDANVYAFYAWLSTSGIGKDIIHVHSGEAIFKRLKIVFPFKPMIMHYHGSDIRVLKKSTVIDKAVHVFYSTKDLARYFSTAKATWCPTPIDRNLYKPYGCQDVSRAVSFDLGMTELTTTIAKQKGLSLTILKREYRWNEIPRLLSQYGYYIDVKKDPVTGELLDTHGYLSMTALQALAMGLKVIDSNGTVYTEFPPEHDAESVATNVYKTYRMITDSYE